MLASSVYDLLQPSLFAIYRPVLFNIFVTFGSKGQFRCCFRIMYFRTSVNLVEAFMHRSSPMSPCRYADAVSIWSVFAFIASTSLSTFLIMLLRCFFILQQVLAARCMFWSDVWYACFLGRPGFFVFFLRRSSCNASRWRFNFMLSSNILTLGNLFWSRVAYPIRILWTQIFLNVLS